LARGDVWDSLADLLKITKLQGVVAYDVKVVREVINKNHRTLCILEFKRSSDRNEDFLRVKENETNEQGVGKRSANEHRGAQSGCPVMDV